MRPKYGFGYLRNVKNFKTIIVGESFNGLLGVPTLVWFVPARYTRSSE